ncbi:hypothetical protein GN156_07275 [bacterium LRH843]|nr:hypothetical protein [bacterium LRH843]
MNETNESTQKAYFNYIIISSYYLKSRGKGGILRNRGDKMEYLNMSSVVKMKFDLANQKYDVYSLNNSVPTFIRNCNNKLSSVGLQISDFKTEEGNYEFSHGVAKRLIQLEELNAKHNLNKMVKENYDNIDLPIMKEYFGILTDLIKIHFSGKKKEMYLLKINALKIEVEINKEKYNIIYSLFSEDSKKKYLLMLEKDLAKIIVEIYSVNKYPFLTEMDRFSILHELYENLTEVLLDHYTIIKIANDIRNHDGEQLKELSIDEIMTHY